ncbi:hypothetical protein U0070_011029 [Myodes glareolus]|uniref:Uncharacterized protein n=1 Tax=Myodes glareolus TaxID=447135 RepID=A0AAW0IHX5_MYOGA
MICTTEQRPDPPQLLSKCQRWRRAKLATHRASGGLFSFPVFPRALLGTWQQVRVMSEQRMDSELNAWDSPQTCDVNSRFDVNSIQKPLSTGLLNKETRLYLTYLFPTL